MCTEVGESIHVLSEMHTEVGESMQEEELMTHLNVLGWFKVFKPKTPRGSGFKV